MLNESAETEMVLALLNLFVCDLKSNTTYLWHILYERHNLILSWLWSGMIVGLILNSLVMT